MTSTSTTARTWITRILVIALVLPGSMFVFLRMLHWNFFLSAFLASALGVGCSKWAVATLKTRLE
jgi:hypothetical protein